MSASIFLRAHITVHTGFFSAYVGMLILVWLHWQHLLALYVTSTGGYCAILTTAVNRTGRIIDRAFAYHAHLCCSYYLRDPKGLQLELVVMV
jgi:hypothetical protein